MIQKLNRSIACQTETTCCPLNSVNRSAQRTAVDSTRRRSAH